MFYIAAWVSGNRVAGDNPFAHWLITHSMFVVQTSACYHRTRGQRILGRTDLLIGKRLQVADPRC